jgi:hypothetical protein
MWTDAADLAASMGVPVEWVPAEWAALSDDEIVVRVEARGAAEMALARRPFFRALLTMRDGPMLLSPRA